MAEYDALNPIRTVDGNYIPCPSKYKYLLQDVSASDSGRTEDTLMHKMRLSQKVKIELEWPASKSGVVAEILQAFNPEYITVQYFDCLQNGYVTKEFYVGDRATPCYNRTMDLWENVSFNIIER